MVSSDATVSSARVINISWFVTSTGLMIADFSTKNALDTANFGLYLTYCAGGFVASKALDYFKFDDLKSGKVVPLDDVGQVIKEKVGSAEWIHISIMTPRYSEVQKAKYGSDEAVFLVTKDGKNYERTT